MILLRRSDVYARSGSLGRSNDGGQASGDVGCSGCSSPEVSIPGVWVSHRVVLNRRRVGLSVAVSGLVTLVVLFGGDVLGRRCSMSVVAALMLPDLRFDFAVMRIRLGLMRVRGVPNHSSFES